MAGRDQGSNKLTTIDASKMSLSSQARRSSSSKASCDSIYCSPNFVRISHDVLAQTWVLPFLGVIHDLVLGNHRGSLLHGLFSSMSSAPTSSRLSPTLGCTCCTKRSMALDHTSSSIRYRTLKHSFVV